MADLFTRRRDIASCPLSKQNHLGKCSNRKLRISTLVNAEPSEVQLILHQHSAMLKS